MRVSIKPGKAAGTAFAPPSKSYAQRILICAALSSGVSRIRGISESEDVLAALDCIEALGADYQRDGDEVIVSGREACDRPKQNKSQTDSSADGCEQETGTRAEGAEQKKAGTVVFPCRESGNTLRFFLPISLCFYNKVRFTGSSRLMERGISVYEEVFQDKNISIKRDSLSIEAEGRLTPGEYTIRGDVSSQFVTGLLFALPLLKGGSTLRILPPIESRPYIDITIDVLKSFGIELTETSEGVFVIPGNQCYQARDLMVEGDWSNGAFLYALKSLGGELSIEGLNSDSRQGDKVCASYFERLDREKPEMDISGCPDLGPVLFALAAAKNGAVITGTRRLRIKESDRAEVMKEELEKLGARLEVSDNSVTVFPPENGIQPPSVPLNGHNDHRIVMALSVLLTLTGGEIEGAEAVGKTWKEFFEVLKGLGIETEVRE